MVETNWLQMIDVKPTNVKLQIRARRILREICGDRCPESDQALDRELEACGRNVKLTAVKIFLGVSVEKAERCLQDAGGVLANLLKAPQGTSGACNGTSGKGKYILCVDGGGSKCSAVIVSDEGFICNGESGPCNPFVNLLQKTSILNMLTS
jgi:N-acetylmuramic acid 6-phosphate etherase